MGEELKRFRRLLLWRLSLLVVVSISTIAGMIWLIMDWSSLATALNVAIAAAATLTILVLLIVALLKIVFRPLDLIATAIGHLQPGASLIGAPELNQLPIGKRLVAKITEQIYKLASGHADDSNIETEQFNLERILAIMPAVVVVLDSKWRVKYYNERAADYIDHRYEKPIGIDYREIFKFSFPGAQTLDDWLEGASRSAITESRIWQRVKHTATDERVFIFDLAAFYSKNEPHGYEVVLVLLDNSKRYQEDEDQMSFVSLAVHELRSPITVLRGYIEMFEQEIGPKLDQELVSFMQKMEVSAAQLSMFINNILNVTRIQNGQLALKKDQINWISYLRQCVEKDLQLRAQTHNRTLKLDLPEQLPFVKIDPVSIYEVISNLVDNAIKYSYDGGEIIVRTYLKDAGCIETTVQDFGIGIPEAVVGNLFERFYRSHRSRNNIGGTGLGLYLCRIIVSSHSGQIWVESKEKQGSIFGFTLPIEATASEKDSRHKEEGIERGSHGWIKNHSLYRR